MKKIFVTVGTTKFDKLIEEISRKENLDVLARLGYTVIQFQVGTGALRDQSHPLISLKYDKYFDDFHQQIASADLVISHAGAGTCLEVLQTGTPLIVVINEDLMDNHQMELASQLESDGYLKCCTTGTLGEFLKEGNVQFKPYPKANPKLFPRFLDQCVGFT